MYIYIYVLKEPRESFHAPSEVRSMVLETSKHKSLFGGHPGDDDDGSCRKHQVIVKSGIRRAVKNS